MRFLDFGYWKDNESIRVNISESFKKEAMRQIGKQLKKDFSSVLDLKQVALSFDSFFNEQEGYLSRLPQLDIQKGIYQVRKFKMYYGGSAMAYSGELTIIDTKGRIEDMLPLDREIEKDEYIFDFNIYEYVLPSVLKLVENLIKRKDIKLFTEFSFPVKVYSPGLDCEIKVNFEEIQSKEHKSKFISSVFDSISEFNKENESGEDSKGLIHNVLKMKSEKTNSDSLTFVVDLGSAGEEGLKVFFKAFEESLIEIDFVEVK